jgi:hypothetical protein
MMGQMLGVFFERTPLSDTNNHKIMFIVSFEEDLSTSIFLCAGVAGVAVAEALILVGT